VVVTSPSRSPSGWTSSWRRSRTPFAAALTAGAGTAIRLAADYAVARTGGSLTGYEPGDVWPGGDEPDEED